METDESYITMPILRNEQKMWEEIEEFDTCGGILPGAEDYFKTIPTEYLPHAKGHVGKVGEAQSYLFDAADFEVCHKMA
jgi:hypothetical protein